MNKLLFFVITIGMALNVSVLGCGKTVAEKRAAKPDIGERLKEEAIAGEITGVGTNYVTIQQANGEVMRVRVDDNTKMDNVIKGDKVKAYVTDDGYASTIQRTDAS
jgi:hypothetical protein